MRTFIAIDLPAAVKQEMRALQRRLQNDLRPIGGDRLFKWTNPDKVHVTLRFLGETSDTQVDQIHADLRRITADAIPFALNLDGIGVFPNWPRVRVLWAGVSGELAALHRLQQAVETAAQAAGFVAEDKSFSPHITLARTSNDARSEQIRRTGEFLRAWSAQQRAGGGAEWRVHEIVHMQSQLRPAGAVYTALAHYSLGYQ
ncbi:MAG: RNA 2',3'-cyclic phosphodiesterase [Caldilineaceae bacterium]